MVPTPLVTSMVDDGMMRPPLSSIDTFTWNRNQRGSIGLLDGDSEEIASSGAKNCFARESPILGLKGFGRRASRIEASPLVRRRASVGLPLLIKSVRLLALPSPSILIGSHDRGKVCVSDLALDEISIAADGGSISDDAVVSHHLFDDGDRLA